MSAMQLEREYFQLQADHGVGNPLWESWEWKTKQGKHYVYSGHSRSLYSIEGNTATIIIEEVVQFWFPEKIGYRPMFVGSVFVGDEEYGEKSYARTERVVSYSSRDWHLIRSENGDLQIWVTLKDGQWVRELIAK